MNACDSHLEDARGQLRAALASLGAAIGDTVGMYQYTDTAQGEIIEALADTATALRRLTWED